MFQKRIATIPLIKRLFFIAILIFSTQSAHAAIVQLSGRVLDNAGAAVANAEVRVLTPPDLIASTFTNSNGEYVTAVEQGTYEVEVIPPASSSLATSRLTGVNLVGNLVLDISLVAAVEQATLSGRVVDGNGQGLSNNYPFPNGQVIQLRRVSDGAGFSARTNAEGYYSVTIPLAANNDYEIRLNVGTSTNLPNGTTQNFTANLQTQGTISLATSRTLDFTLPLAVALTATVVDQGGVPVLGARVDCNWGKFRTDLR